LVNKLLVDTGPLVAALVETDSHHAWAVERLHELPAPFLTCEPVLAETFYLVCRLHNGPRRFFELLGSGLLTIEFDVLAEREPLQKLIYKYTDLPMSLADACLVRMAEQIHDAVVFTTDSHFRTYRRNGRQIIPLIIPDL
jgi:predicted nucleic acid-binding protein